MGQLLQMIWLAYMLSLHAMVTANCTVIQDSTTYQEQYDDCRQYYGCQSRVRTVETGPIIYKCLYIDDVKTMNSGLREDIENIIYVEQTNFSTLEPNSYSWTNLTELYMEHSSIKNIIPGFFNRFETLRVLEVTNNQLESIIDGVFSSLASLTKLNLTGNSIQSLTDHSFSGLLNLKILDLSRNKVASISPHIFNYLPFLQHVDISQNFISNVNYTFELPLAETINISKNNLTEFDFKQLETSLVLQTLDLSENNLENITNLNSLCAKTLSMSFNKIKDLKDIRCVTNLNVSHNQLKITYDSQFKSDLELLDVSFNQISEVNANSFQNSTNLKYLYLDHNKLEEIPTDLLINQNKLEVLKISYNNIKQIPFGLFNNLEYLSVLDVSDNGMVLDFDALSTLLRLEELYFKNNNVKNFNPAKVLVRFMYLRYITLNDNLWNCSELANTIHLLQLKKIDISKGNNTKVSNILGISCRDNEELKEEVIQLKLGTTEKLSKKNISSNNVSTATYDKMPLLRDNDEITILNSINKSISDLSENLKSVLKSQDEYINKSIWGLSQNMKTQNNNLSLLLLDLKSVLPVKFVSSDPVQVGNENYGIYLFICNMLLVLILGCILYHLYFNIYRQKYVRLRLQDQVQLM